MPPKGFEKGTKHWIEINSLARQIGQQSGCFVKFGNDEHSFSGVLRGANLGQFRMGDKVFARVDNLFFSNKANTWKFDLAAIRDENVRFPLVRRGYIVIPREKFNSDLDGVVLEDFADYVQESGQMLEYSDPAATVTIDREEYYLLAPEGILEIVDQIVSKKPFELTVLGIDTRDMYSIIVKLAHPKFPEIPLGLLELRKFRGPAVKLARGDKVRCVFDIQVTNMASFFESVMDGRMIYDLVSKVEPTLEELAEKTGLPEALCAFVKELTPDVPVELVIVKNTHDFSWSLAHPDFPDHPIGFSHFGDWFLLGQGDRALFVPSLVRDNFLIAAADGRMVFNFKPRKLEPGTVVQGEVSPPGDNTYGSAKEAFVRIKGSQKAIIPAFMLAGRAAGEELMVRILSETGMGWHLSVPEELYKNLLALQQEMLVGIEAEVIGDSMKTENYGPHAALEFKNYKIRINFKGLLFEAALPAPVHPIEGLTIGQKVIVKEWEWPYRKMDLLVRALWGQDVNLMFVRMAG